MYDDVFDKLHIIWLVIMVIHFILLLGLWFTGTWAVVFSPTPVGAVLLWFIINDFSGIFACIFAAYCFSVNSIIGKILLYPIGIIIMLMVFITISFPFLMLGLFIGGWCQIFGLKLHK